MRKLKMKNEILKVLADLKGNVIFPELIERIPGFAGDYDFSLNGQTLLWSGLSREAIKALVELLKEGKIIDFSGKDILITYKIISPILYNLPVAKKTATYV